MDRRRLLLIAAPLLCLAAAAQKPVKIVRSSGALEFSYSWPGEAAAIPALDRRFRKDLTKDYREALATALDDQKAYKEYGRTGVRDFTSMDWTTLGVTPRLLSLESQFSNFTGGAHPNTSYGSLLWDRKLNRETSTQALLTRPPNFAAITRAAYCKALNAERAKRRQGMEVDLPDFNSCPQYSELAIAPADRNRDGRFDHIQFVASPYLAGPYVEGEYAIAVPVTPKLVAAMKPQYRSSFEVQRQ